MSRGQTEGGLSWDKNLANRGTRKRSWLSSAFGSECPQQNLHPVGLLVDDLDCDTVLHLFFLPSLPPLTGQQRLHSENEPGSQTESLSMWLSDTQRDGRQNSISLSSLPHISSLIYASFCALCVFKLRILQQKTKFHMNIKQKNKTKHKRSGKICYKCTVRGNWSSSARRLWRINLQVSVYWLSKLVQALIPWMLYRAENPHRHIKLVLIRWSLGVEDFVTLH